eukprot:4425202-Pyramimonas_sp.AAC.1
MHQDALPIEDDDDPTWWASKSPSTQTSLRRPGGRTKMSTEVIENQMAFHFNKPTSEFPLPVVIAFNDDNAKEPGKEKGHMQCVSTEETRCLLSVRPS